MSKNDRNELLRLDVGQANELKLAFRREGSWSSKDIKDLCEKRGLLKQVLAVLRGVGEVKLPGPIIDFEATPVVPEGSILIWEEEIFPVGGLGVFRPEQVTVRKIHKNSFDRKENVITCRDVREKMSRCYPFGAQLLDLYVENPELAPAELKENDVILCFWGSFFLDATKHAYIRTLTWKAAGYWFEGKLFMNHVFPFDDERYVSLMFC